MENQVQDRFRLANQELRDFLRRIVRLANGTGTVSEEELCRVTQRLLSLAPEIGDASRGEILNADLQEQIAEYVTNLRALQEAMEKIRCVALARREQWKATKQQIEGLQNWVPTYPQPTH